MSVSVQAPEVASEERERVIVSTKKEPIKRKTTSTAVDDLTSEEREAVTIVFHQYETGLREGTIFTKVKTTWKDRRITRQTLIISRVSSQCSNLV